MQPLRTENNASFRLFYMVVFHVKYGHKSITNEMQARMEILFADVLEKWGCRLREYGGEPDHVYILFEGKPAIDLSRLVGNLKTVSARKLRLEFPEHLARDFGDHPHFWAKSYALVSIGERISARELFEQVTSSRH